MRKEILLACACVLCLSACGTGTKEQSKNPQKALEVGAETTPKSVEATSSPMVQKIKNTSWKRENLGYEAKRFFCSGSQIWHWQWLCFGIWSELGVYFL